MATPDEQAIEQAQPTEQQERAHNPFQFMGPALQGSPANEPYLIGNENDARQGIGQLPAGYDADGGIEHASGVSMGAVASQQVGMMQDAMQGLDSDGQSFFHDNPVTPVPAMDNMHGVVNHAVPGTLLDEKMYLDAGNMPIDAFEAGNVEPELQGE